MKKIAVPFLLVLIAVASCAAPQSSVDPYRGFGEAQGTAQYFSAQLTGTAYAPILAITLTSADLTMQSAYMGSTETSAAKTQSAAQTATATLWTPTPSMTPTPNATTTLAFANLRAETTKINLGVESKKRTSVFYSFIFPAFLLAALLALAYSGITVSRHFRIKPFQRDARGLAPLLGDVVDGVISDPDANPNYSTSKALAKVMPVTPERQHAQRMIQADIIARLPQAGAKPQKQNQTPQYPRIENPQPVLRSASQLLLQSDMEQVPEADWSLMENWDGTGAVPYAVSKNGLARVDISTNYHFAAFGSTGEGKSRGFGRPFIGALLVNGQRVIMLGKTGDFWIFEEHPNATLIPVRDMTEKVDAQFYAGVLRSIVKEMNQRDAWLTSRHISTWERAGRENTYVVLDEVGNALEQMLKPERDECMRWIASLVKQGRKNGVSVITASQRAVGFKNIVEQMDRIVYRLADEGSSRIALGEAGAELLPKHGGKFFSKLDKIELCASFNPTDEQLQAFLSRSVKELEKPTWIEGVVKDVEPLPAAKSSEEQKIKDLYLGYLSRHEAPNLRAIQREVYGQDDNPGGAHFKIIKRVIADLEGVTATDTENKADFYLSSGSDDQ